MASVFRNKTSGNTRIQVTLADGSRKSLTLGRMTRKMEDEFCRRVEELEAATRFGIRPDDGTIAWAMTVDPAYLTKLSEWGLLPVGLESRLIPEEPREARTTGFLTDEFLKARENSKTSSRNVWIRAKNLLVAFLGRNRDIETLTVGDAKAFRKWMLEERGIASTTANKMISVCRQFFGYAIDFEWIEKNPFVSRDLPTTVRANKSRQAYVDRDTVVKVINACPSAEWRLLVTLSRFAGLRMPSEVRFLRWDNVLWDQNRLLITSPKTEHHEGKETRIIPLFPEVVKYLNEVWDASGADPSEFVISDRYRKSGVNLRTHFERIICKAGVKAWPKLWHNLRASCQTDLAKEHPGHVVCAWMGNSEQIANEHYLQVTDADFEKACAYCVQKELAPSIIDEKQKTENLENPGDFRGHSETCGTVHVNRVDVTGLEPVTPTMSR